MLTSNRFLPQVAFFPLFTFPSLVLALIAYSNSIFSSESLLGHFFHVRSALIFPNQSTKRIDVLTPISLDQDQFNSTNPTPHRNAGLTPFVFFGPQVRPKRGRRAFPARDSLHISALIGRNQVDDYVPSLVPGKS